MRVEGTSWRETNLWCVLSTPTQLSLSPALQVLLHLQETQGISRFRQLFSELIPVLRYE